MALKFSGPNGADVFLFGVVSGKERPVDGVAELIRVVFISDGHVGNLPD